MGVLTYGYQFQERVKLDGSMPETYADWQESQEGETSMNLRRYLAKTYTLYVYYWLSSPLGSWEEVVYGGYMARLARRLGY